jgi:transposase
MSWEADGSLVSLQTISMRFPQGGGLTAELRAFREEIRLETATHLAAGLNNATIVRELRVHVCSVKRWRLAWADRGEAALRSKGPASHSQLFDELFAVFEAELGKGPAAHGWPDQKWTLGLIKTLIGQWFHKSYTEQGVRNLLIRHGWSWQVPARRALERGEAAVAVWAKETWLAVEERRRSGPGSSSKTKPGSRRRRRPPAPGPGVDAPRSSGCAAAPDAGCPSPH